jgi:hypothetical protein
MGTLPPTQSPQWVSMTTTKMRPYLSSIRTSFREFQKANSIQCIEGMRIQPKEVSKFDILLYRMVYMPLVRPTLAHDIKRLEAKFTHGYRLGASVFYVSITNEYRDERFVKDVDTSNWGPH